MLTDCHSTDNKDNPAQPSDTSEQLVSEEERDKTVRDGQSITLTPTMTEGKHSVTHKSSPQNELQTDRMKTDRTCESLDSVLSPSTRSDYGQVKDNGNQRDECNRHVWAYP